MVPSVCSFIVLAITKVTVRAPEGQIIAHCGFMILSIDMCTSSAKAIETK